MSRSQLQENMDFATVVPESGSVDGERPASDVPSMRASESPVILASDLEMPADTERNIPGTRGYPLLAVEVPTFADSGVYVAIPGEDVVQTVLEERDEGGELSYRVRFQDRHIEIVGRVLHVHIVRLRLFIALSSNDFTYSSLSSISYEVVDVVKSWQRAPQPAPDH